MRISITFAAVILASVTGCGKSAPAANPVQASTPAKAAGSTQVKTVFDPSKLIAGLQTKELGSYVFKDRDLDGVLRSTGVSKVIPVEVVIYNSEAEGFSLEMEMFCSNPVSAEEYGQFLIVYNHVCEEIFGDDGRKKQHEFFEESMSRGNSDAKLVMQFEAAQLESWVNGGATHRMINVQPRFPQL